MVLNLRILTASEPVLVTEATKVRSAIEFTEGEFGVISTTRPSALVKGEARAEAMKAKQMREERANIFSSE